jgi:hypothetical protein
MTNASAKRTPEQRTTDEAAAQPVTGAIVTLVGDARRGTLRDRRAARGPTLPGGS